MGQQKNRNGLIAKFEDLEEAFGLEKTEEKIKSAFMLVFIYIYIGMTSNWGREK